MKIDFVPDIKNWWRWVSVRMILAATALETAWFALPHEFKSDVPDWLRTLAIVAILVGAFLGRIIKQDLTDA